MSNQDFHKDSLNDAEFGKPALPGGLNVLTILTFIGSGIQLFLVAIGFFSAQKSYDEKDKMLAQMSSPEMPGFLKAMMPNPANYEEMVTKSLENRLPILILGVVAVALCVYGAIQMRQLKMQGYLFYLAGQLLPFLSTVLFLGMFMFAGVGFAVATAITLLFILMYTLNRKYLIN